MCCLLFADFLFSIIALPMLSGAAGDLNTVHGMPIPYCHDLTIPLSLSEIMQWVDAAASKI